MYCIIGYVYSYYKISSELNSFPLCVYFVCLLSVYVLYLALPHEANVSKYGESHGTTGVSTWRIPVQNIIWLFGKKVEYT